LLHGQLITKKSFDELCGECLEYSLAGDYFTISANSMEIVVVRLKVGET
jgi:hypothetical protein